MIAGLRTRAWRGLLLGALLAGCASDDSTDDDGAGTGATSAGSTSMQAGTGSGAGRGAGTGAAAGKSGAGAGAGGAGATASGGGRGGAQGGANAPAFTMVGVCGTRGEGEASETAFMGIEEFYIVGEEGFGLDICVVRFDVKRVGAAPEGCADPTAEVDCRWTHKVEFSNPEVVTDEDGVCADSELGLTPAAIAEIDGSQASYGFLNEFAGHESVLMKYDDEDGEWVAHGNGTWDEATSTYGFDRRDGLCDY